MTRPTTQKPSRPAIELPMPRRPAPAVVTVGGDENVALGTVAGVDEMPELRVAARRVS